MPSLDVGINARKAKAGANDFTDATRKIQAESKKTDASLASTDQKTKSLGKTLAKAGLAFVTLGAAYKGARFIGAAVKEFAAFEMELANVSTMLDEQTMHYMPLYEKQVADLAVELGESTATLSKGLYDTLSASIPAANAMEFLGVAGKAAKAGLTDTGTAADALTTILNSYSLEATEAERISDILFATVKRGKTTFGELAGGIGKITSLAASAGLSIEEVGAALATMTRAGIQTDIALTSLKAIITTFLSPQEGARKAAEEFGIVLDANTLRTIGLTGVVQKLTGATAEQRSAIFGNIRAITGLSALVQQADGHLADLGFTIDSTGKSQEALNKVSDTTTQKLNRASEGWKRIKRQLGGEVAPAVERVAGRFEDGSSPLAKWVGLTADFMTINLADELEKEKEALKGQREEAEKLTRSWNEMVNALPKGPVKSPFEEMLSDLSVVERAIQGVGAPPNVEAFLNVAAVPSEQYILAMESMEKATAEFQKQIDDFEKTDLEKHIENLRLIGSDLKGAELREFTEALEGVKQKMIELDDLEKDIATRKATAERLKEEAQARQDARDLAQEYIREVQLEKEILWLTNDERERAIKLAQLEAATKRLGVEASEDLVEQYKRELESLQEAREAAEFARTISSGLGDIARAPLQAVLQETQSFGEYMEDELKRIGQRILMAWFDMLITQHIQKAAMSFLGGLAGMPMVASAKGNIFDRGGIVSQPTIFPMAKGAGIMAEKKPEAVVPLERDMQGRLGVVNAGGGGGVHITNVFDPGIMDQWAETESGEQRIVNVIRQNREAIDN
jgi:TP901 family phage tail tape measure protein